MTTNPKNTIILALAAFTLTACHSGNKQAAQETKITAKDTITSIDKGQQARADTINQGNTVFPADTLLKTKVLTTGTFHEEEVWKTASKEKWFGLFKGKEGFYLSQTAIKTIKVNDAIADEDENEKTGWEVTTSIKDSCIMLIEALPYLNNRKIQDIPISKKNVYPGESLSFSYSGNPYKLFATGEKTKVNPETFDVKNYKLYLTATINGKQKTQLLAAQAKFDDRMIDVLFAGDMDGDGILDFIIDTSNHYNMGRPTIYLSKPAENGQLVKPVGAHITTGC